MNFATKSNYTKFRLADLVHCLVTFNQPTPISPTGDNSAMPLLVGVVCHNPQNWDALSPATACYRWKQRALQKYRAWRRLPSGQNGLHGGPV
ncbi:MAG: hypothetical protein IPM76_22325 [Chloroflexi bacterium]|nr:hypothetical protein [Chloroflexota bacterium]